MKLVKMLDWLEPISLARRIPVGRDYILLYSGLNHEFTGRFSFLAVNKKQEIIAENFDEFAKSLSANSEKFDNAWFGYLGYGLKNSLEKLSNDLPSIITMPNLLMVQYETILRFDHINKNIEFWSSGNDNFEDIIKDKEISARPLSIKVENLSSNMTKDEYLQKVSVIQNCIRSGDIYQANLTRKFYGELYYKDDTLEIFAKLAEISPSPYSAFLKWGDNSIISSSPERFLFVDEKGNVDTRPIKGSAPRFENKKQDEESRIALENSAKDKAENLMIVDLSRNDLSRNCIPGSVKTENLYKVTSYATVHHMASTVLGKKLANASCLDVVKGCFPPGSMTGAPKIKAMQICSDLEKIARGVYSGAIGWFGGDGSADLSVVIRTLVVSGNKFEFQVGGAITSDSLAESEWEETMTKAKAIAKTLDLSMEKLRSI